LFSGQSAKVLIGMQFLSKLPGRVVEIGFRPPFLRRDLNRRSIVDGLIRLRRSSKAALIRSSLCCLRTLIISGRNGCKRFEHSLSLASQIVARAAAASGPYSFGLPLHLPFLAGPDLFKSLMAAFRCILVTCTNSSNIFRFPSFEVRKYLGLIAFTYSKMLFRVMLPLTSYGNINFDASTTISVTIIMTQCALFQ
jgi:hypothetical protein